MKISIVIPSINEEDNLRSLLPLLRKQGNAANLEIILADGGSNDRTEELCQLHEVIYTLSPQKGRAVQMNYGASLSSGDVLYFVHADAKPPETFIHDIQQAIHAGFPIGCYRFKFDSNRLLLRMNSYFTRFDRIMCRGGDQTLYVTKDLFEELGGYKDDYIVMEDYDFIIRARKKYPFKIMNGDVIVSARKYIENSYLRVNLANLTVFMLFFAGTHPNKLLSIYKSMIKHPKA